MEKVFKALGIIIETLSNDKGHIMCRKELDVIIQALTELNAIKEANPSEALEDFEKMIQQVFQVDSEFEIYRDKVKQHILKSQEQEKVLRIVFEKRINVDKFVMDFINDEKFYGYEYYKENYLRYGIGLLTQEEFDLLKRWANERM